MKIDFTEHHSISYRIWAPDNPMFISEQLTRRKIFKQNVFLSGTTGRIKFKNFIIRHMEWSQMSPRHGKPCWYEWGRDISWGDRMKECKQKDKWLVLK